ncbi:MAG: thiamine-phosphate synthase family protein [Halobacteriaceae archaeon]
MRFVEEVVVDEFLPTFRSLLASALRERGLTQREVAEAIGVSQSAVSKYAHGEVAIRDEVASDRRIQELVEEIADGLVDGEMSQVQALVEAEVRIRQLEAQGDLIARLHAEQMPGLDEYGVGRGIHDADSEVRLRERTLASVRRGLRLLETTTGAASCLPAVGSNLVECLPDGADIADVAAVPGRIFEVKGRVTVPGNPEFGVSGHVATVLLGARDGGADAAAALNVAYDGARLDALRTAGHTTREFPAETEDLRPAIAEVVGGATETTVLYQTGGFGVEPMIYLLGRDAEAVVRALREVL